MASDEEDRDAETLASRFFSGIRVASTVVVVGGIREFDDPLDAVDGVGDDEVEAPLGNELTVWFESKEGRASNLGLDAPATAAYGREVLSEHGFEASFAGGEKLGAAVDV